MDAALAGPRPRCVALIGGAEAKTGHALVLTAVLSRTGRRRPVVAVCAAAAADPAERLEVYSDAFGQLGARVVDITPTSRAHANTPELAEVALDADVVFATGGNQCTLTHLVAGTLLATAIHTAGARGAVLAGTSAGAAAAARTMISGGRADGRDVRVAPGLGWLPDVVVDQHFTQRGRFERLAAGLATIGAASPGPLTGVGVDEDTALILTTRSWTVVGAGTVTVRDNVGDVRTLPPGSRGRIADLPRTLRADAAPRSLMSPLPA